ncbi:MAG: phospholipid/cholesterol/gamma-HCH transport system permease protein [Flavobacteriales bacterium]|jgi:phospholipid/cholesterol/gamma-HCH transport system permease protein
MPIFNHIGRYFILLGNVFSRPERFSVYWKQIVFEIDKIGIKSIGIIAMLSAFMGAVICIQTAAQIDSGWIPAYTIGFTVRQTTILEFSPTIMLVILAGKVGSNIASEIGTMRISEQIDAIEIMGVNSAGYLILPKIIAACLIIPFLVIISMFLGIGAGALIGVMANLVSYSDYELGLHLDFKPFQVAYAIIKSFVFAFLMTTISAYCGYYVKGGALEVGRASTQAVVYSVVFIMIFNVILTILLLL